MTTTVAPLSALEPAEDVFVQVEVAKSPEELERTATERRARGRRALTAGISLAALGSFVGVTHLLRSRRANLLDHAVMRAIARLRGPRLNGAVRDVTSLGGVALVSAAAVTGIAVARRSPLAALQIALGGVGGAIGELSIKRHVARPRPSLVEHLQYVNSWSFPSGHAIAASGVYLTLAMVAGRFTHSDPARAAMLVGAASLAGAVGASRVYLGVHYPSDVVGGLAFGTAWACLLDAGFDFAGASALDERRRRMRAERVRQEDRGT